MKTKFAYLILFTLSTYYSNAQITKGNWMLGGSGSFSFSKSERKSTESGGTTINYSTIGTYSILLEPNIGYFIKNRFALGLKLNYLTVFNEGSSNTTDNDILGLNPYVRYYFLPDDKIYNFFIEPSFGYNINKASGNSTAISIKGAHVLFLNNSVGVETSINYVVIENDLSRSQNIYLGAGLQIHLEKE